MALGGGDETRVKDEIHRRIPAYRQLRGNDKVSPGFDQFPVGAKNFVRVTGKISDGRVDLRDTRFQGSRELEEE